MTRPDASAERGMQLLASWLVKRAREEEDAPGSRGASIPAAITHADGTTVAPPRGRAAGNLGPSPHEDDIAA